MSIRNFWTDAEVEILVRDYPDTPTTDIAKQLGMTVKQVYSKAGNLGLKKSDVYMAGPHASRLRRGDNVGLGSRFQKGHTTWNKGVKGLHLSPETQYKPGNRSGKALMLYQPIGSERVSKEGYRQRKINDDMPFQKRWRAVHILVWEAANGPLPAGHAVVFKNGDRSDASLDNLELVNRAELMKRNSLHNLPKAIAKAYQLVGAVRRQINRKKDKRP